MPILLASFHARRPYPVLPTPIPTFGGAFRFHARRPYPVLPTPIPTPSGGASVVEAIGA